MTKEELEQECLDVIRSEDRGGAFMDLMFAVLDEGVEETDVDQ